MQATIWISVLVFFFIWFCWCCSNFSLKNWPVSVKVGFRSGFWNSLVLNQPQPPPLKIQSVPKKRRKVILRRLAHYLRKILQDKSSRCDFKIPEFSCSYSSRYDLSVDSRFNYLISQFSWNKFQWNDILQLKILCTKQWKQFWILATLIQNVVFLQKFGKSKN